MIFVWIKDVKYLMKAIKIKGLNIGQGSPKVVVSLIERTSEDIINKANRLKEMKVDLVEWRLDFYEDPSNISSVLHTLNKLRSVLDNIPLIFTFRSSEEGGQGEISLEEYTLLNKKIANSGKVDFIDVQIFSDENIVMENIQNIHEAGVLVIGSYHNFYNTPEKEEIVSRLIKIQDMGADILKIAVMPKTFSDVIKLLEATNIMYSKYANRPLVTMAMGPLGVISRIAGEAFGSAMTFASAGVESAPGQIPLEDLTQILGIIHKSMKE